jgi:subtilase family serine protease
MAPGANIIVFVAPQNTTMLTAMNSTINGLRLATGGYGGIISLSWHQCEREITDSDADTMEALLKAATYSGITVFASSGDTGSTCVNGGVIYPNRINYPGRCTACSRSGRHEDPDKSL